MDKEILVAMRRDLHTMMRQVHERVQELDDTLKALYEKEESVEELFDYSLIDQWTARFPIKKFGYKALQEEQKELYVSILASLITLNPHSLKCTQQLVVINKIRNMMRLPRTLEEILVRSRKVCQADYQELALLVNQKGYRYKCRFIYDALLVVSVAGNTEQAELKSVAILAADIGIDVPTVKSIMLCVEAHLCGRIRYMAKEEKNRFQRVATLFLDKEFVEKLVRRRYKKNNQ